MKKLTALLSKRYIKFVFLAVSGIMTGLTVCFPALGILEWLSIIPMSLVIYSLCASETHRLRSIYFYGLFYFMCYFATTWHWFYTMYPMSYTGMSELSALFVVLAAILGLPLLQSTAFAFVFFIGAIIARGKLAKKLPFMIPFVFAMLWTIFEWAQTLFWFGVPWGRLSIGQTEILVTVQTASLFGCYIVTFLLVAVNFLLAHAILYVEKKNLFAITAAAVFSVNALIGSGMLLFSEKSSGETVKVAVIQPNISSTEKWEYDWFPSTAEPCERLTKEAVNEGAEIVIWPETVLPIEDIFESYECYNFIVHVSEKYNITLLVGTNYTNDDGEIFNSIVTVFPDGTISETIYSKQVLVPFGEYLPMRDFLSVFFPAFGKVNIMGDDWTPGKDSYVVETPKADIGSAICFDSIYENNLRNSVINGAEFLAIETNDSWFYDSSAVYMHLAQAKLRAVETGRFVARSANTGVSAIITDKGIAVDLEAPLVEGYCVGDIELKQNKTLYSIIGNLFVYLNIASVAGVIIYDIIIKIKTKEEDDAN